MRKRCAVAGFEPKVRRVPNGEVPLGIVFEQSPVEGTLLAKGGIVEIQVSTGKKTVTVPGGGSVGVEFTMSPSRVRRSR